MECLVCHGRTFVTVKHPKLWKQCGVTATIGTRTATEICPNCAGSGLAVDPARDPNCGQCHGRGWRGVVDCMDGSYDGTEPCPCERPEVA